MSDADRAAGAPKPTSSRPETWLDWADFFSKTVLSVAGFAVTVVGAWLGWVEFEKTEAAKARYQQEDVFDRERNGLLEKQVASQNTVKGMVDAMPEKTDDPKAATKFRMLIAACNDTAQIGFGTAEFTAVCRDISDQGAKVLTASSAAATAGAGNAVKGDKSKSFVNSQAVASQNVGLAATEAAVPPSPTAKYFAVIATLPQSSPEAVHDLAQQLDKKLQDFGLPSHDVHVYRTKISRSFALTSGGEKTQAEAVKRARALRKVGVADAFVQVDRDWTKADEMR